MRIGIDASNIKLGGGVSNLIKTIEQLCLNYNNQFKIFLFTGNKYINIGQINNLQIVYIKQLNRGYISRYFWQIFISNKEFNYYKIDVLYVPGGVYLGKFKKIVVLSQNLLPFDKKELSQFFPYKSYFRLFILRYLQLYTFKKAKSIIFLTNYSKNIIGKYLSIPPPIFISNNAISYKKNNFFIIKDFDFNYTIKIIYVSQIDFYKHQLNVIKSIHNLLKTTNYKIHLTLVGKIYQREYKKVKKYIIQHNLNDNLTITGLVEANAVEKFILESDIALFASSCESFPVTLLEYMSVGIPIISSNLGPMPEVLKNAGIYFNPYNIEELSSQLYKFITNKSLREESSFNSINVLQSYTLENSVKQIVNAIVD